MVWYAEVYIYLVYMFSSFIIQGTRIFAEWDRSGPPRIDGGVRKGDT